MSVPGVGIIQLYQAAMSHPTDAAIIGEFLTECGLRVKTVGTEMGAVGERIGMAVTSAIAITPDGQLDSGSVSPSEIRRMWAQVQELQLLLSYYESVAIAAAAAGR